MNLQQPLPIPTGPMVDSERRPTRIWLDFFRNMLTRTGGPIGPAGTPDELSDDSQIIGWASEPPDAPRAAQDAQIAALLVDPPETPDLSPLLAAQADQQALSTMALEPDVPALTDPLAGEMADTLPPAPDLDQPVLMGMAFSDPS